MSEAVRFRSWFGFCSTRRRVCGRADQLRFNRWVARRVHHFGMSVALKNDGPQARQLVGAFDFAVVESCFRYNECSEYSVFVRAGKAVFAAEYEIPPSAFCAQARALRFSAIRKSFGLFARPGFTAESAKRRLGSASGRTRGRRCGCARPMRQSAAPLGPVPNRSVLAPP